MLSTEIWLAAAALPEGGALLYWPEEVYCCAFAAPELAANAAARLALTKVLYDTKISVEVLSDFPYSK